MPRLIHSFIDQPTIRREEDYILLLMQTLAHSILPSRERQVRAHSSVFATETFLSAMDSLGVVEISLFASNPAGRNGQLQTFDSPFWLRADLGSDLVKRIQWVIGIVLRSFKPRKTCLRCHAPCLRFTEADCTKPLRAGRRRTRLEATQH